MPLWDPRAIALPWLVGPLLTVMLTGLGWSAEPTLPSFSLPPHVRRQIEEEVQMHTLGGRQFWSDVQFWGRWRIQQNVFTGHYRLLDPQDRRHASGSLEQCQMRLSELREERRLPAMSGKGVILLHGLIRSSRSLYTVADELDKAGLHTFPCEYSSTQISIPDAAENLDQIIRHLDGIEELYLVGHSMGGLVIRAWFARHADPRVRRVVMMGTPNHGAELADRMKPIWLVRAAVGPAGRQLVTGDDSFIATLPAPECEFAIIAGARGTSTGWNPLIPGDDDGTVTVTSTRLEGAADFATVPVLHHALLGDEQTSQMVARFLLTGRLREDSRREPIVSASSGETTTPTVAR